MDDKIEEQTRNHFTPVMVRAGASSAAASASVFSPIGGCSPDEMEFPPDTTGAFSGSMDNELGVVVPPLPGMGGASVV